MSDITIDDLSDEEARSVRRGKRNRLDSCEDGCCGGCPSCLEAHGIKEDDE
jgi:hypothetical protein